MEKQSTGINIYLSSFSEKLIHAYRKLYEKAELNILISYGTRQNYYYDIIFTHRNLINSLILDSGAFSINNASSETAESITLPGFIEYCKHTHKQFDFIFNYDEDFEKNGFRTNYINMREIEKEGIKVVPVVHDYLGEVTEELDYYIEKQYPIIALGYSEHKMKNKKQNIAFAVNKIVKAGLKVHLLGVTDIEVLKDLPVHFCDSSTWVQESMHGNVMWWNPYRKGDNKSNSVHFLDKEGDDEKWNHHIYNYPYRKHFEKYLKEELSMTIVDLYGHAKTFNRQLANVHYFVRLQDEIRKLHKKYGIKLT